MDGRDLAQARNLAIATHSGERLGSMGRSDQAGFAAARFSLTKADHLARRASVLATTCCVSQSALRCGFISAAKIESRPSRQSHHYDFNPLPIRLSVGRRNSIAVCLMGLRCV